VAAADAFAIRPHRKEYQREYDQHSRKPDVVRIIQRKIAAITKRINYPLKTSEKKTRQQAENERGSKHTADQPYEKKAIN
jgi:hypothetical protein